MNKTFKKDFERIIKTYKKTNNPNIKNSYLQSYFICFMLSLTFFYQLKYRLDFNEIERFFIENNKEHNISTLLDYIDIQSIEEFIRENTKRKRR